MSDLLGGSSSSPTKKPSMRLDYARIAKNTLPGDAPTVHGYKAAFPVKRKRKGKGKGKKKGGKKLSGDGDAVGASLAVPKAKAKAKSTKGKKRKQEIGVVESRRLRIKQKTPAPVGCDGLRAKDLSTVVILRTAPCMFLSTKERVAAGNKVYSRAFKAVERKLQASGHAPSVTVIHEKARAAGTEAKLKWLAKKA